jgi:hypothetical protein
VSASSSDGGSSTRARARPADGDAPTARTATSAFADFNALTSAVSALFSAASAAFARRRSAFSRRRSSMDLPSSSWSIAGATASARRALLLRYRWGHDANPRRSRTSNPRVVDVARRMSAATQSARFRLARGAGRFQFFVFAADRRIRTE